MTTPQLTTFAWRTAALVLTFDFSHGPVKLTDIRPQDEGADQRSRFAAGRQPLVEIAVTAFGQAGDESKLIGTAIGARLSYHQHTAETDGPVERLTITQNDSDTGLSIDSVFEVVRGAPAVRAFTKVQLGVGHEPVRVLHVSSFATAAVISDSITSLDIWSATSSPRAEARWGSAPLRSPGLEIIDAEERGEYSWAGRQVIGFGARSTLFSVPAGALVDRDTGTTLAWQIEHNGAWIWEVGELPDRNRGVIPAADRLQSPEAAGHMRDDSSNDGAFVVAAGPVESRHGWSVLVTPDAPFTSVPATFTVAATRDAALGNLTLHRRAARRTHPQNDTLPVVFNDYMNTLVADPTEAKLLPLIDAAAAAGADYFVIDDGWYDDTAGWWESIGDWQAATTRFPSTLKGVLDHIRSTGMAPGLWMEPEVIGVNSEAASTLPSSAFITRDGVRVRVNGRYFLDLRQPEARAHLDRAVDYMVGDLGASYFKFDYNVSPGMGLDRDSDSLGDGLLQHNRALIEWMRSLLERYPTIIIEGCSGGGGRTDFGTLSTLQLTSTSDQENPLLYPAIAVGALAHILPEQAGNWAYPQSDMKDHEIAFSMVSGLAGRLYLAGVLNTMSDTQLAIVRTGVEAHNTTKHFVANALPFFPLDFPDWNDSWATVGFRNNPEAPDEQLLIVWALPGAADAIDIPVHTPPGATIERIYPDADLGAGWDATAAGDTVHVTRADLLPTAAVFRISSERANNV